MRKTLLLLPLVFNVYIVYLIAIEDHSNLTANHLL